MAENANTKFKIKNELQAPIKQFDNSKNETTSYNLCISIEDGLEDFDKIEKQSNLGSWTVRTNRL